MRSRRVLRAVALALALSLGGWACSGDDQAQDGNAAPVPGQPGEDGMSAGDATRIEDATDGELVEGDPTAGIVWADVEVPSELFVPPRAVNRNAEMQAASIRTLTVCDGWERVGGFREPEAYDIDALIGYGMQAYSYLGLVDPDKLIENRRRQSERDPAMVPVPDEVKQAMETVRLSLYRFQIRLTFAKSMVKDRRITQDQLNHRIDLAWVHLAAAEYTDAARLLDTFLIEEC